MKEGGPGNRIWTRIHGARGIPCVYYMYYHTTTLPECLPRPPCMRPPFMANPACVLSARRIPHMTSVFPAR